MTLEELTEKHNIDWNGDVSTGFSHDVFCFYCNAPMREWWEDAIDYERHYSMKGMGTGNSFRHPKRDYRRIRLGKRHYLVNDIECSEADYLLICNELNRLRPDNGKREVTICRL